MDVRTIASSYAQFLQSFCKYSHSSEHAYLTIQLAAPLVTPNALSSDAFQFSIDQVVNTIRTEGAMFGVSILYIIKEGMTGSQLISGLGTNAMVYVSQYSANMATFFVNRYEMEDGTMCSCFPSIQCIMPASLYTDPAKSTITVNRLRDNNIRVSGMRTACYPIDGVLASTLECYFDPNCIQTLVSNATQFKPLNASKLIHSSPTTTIQELVSNLMIENLVINYSERMYYTQCAPKLCSYSYTHGNTVLYFITMIIGLFGGYNTVLQIFIPLIVGWIVKIKQILSRSVARRKTQLPTVSTEIKKSTPGKLSLILIFSDL